MQCVVEREKRVEKKKGKTMIDNEKKRKSSRKYSQNIRREKRIKKEVCKK